MIATDVDANFPPEIDVSRNAILLADADCWSLIRNPSRSAELIDAVMARQSARTTLQDAKQASVSG